MIPALAVLVVLSATPGKPASPSGKPVQKRTLDAADATVDEFLTAATALTLDRSLDEAQKVIDLGRKRYPAEQGFHLKQGDLLAVRGRIADAFYEYLWEVMRAGNNDTGAAAAKAIGRLLSDGARGTEVNEIQQVMIAQVNLMTRSRDSLEAVQKIEAVRGRPFALRMIRASAHVVAGELDAAEKEFRSLIAEDKYFVPAYVELGGVLRLKGKIAEADAQDATARAIDANHPSFTSPALPSPAP